MKKSSTQTRIGEAGVALIFRRVSAMGHHWHPTSGPDTGIDGEIELVDPGTGEVRNFRVAVQSKATEGIWRSETDHGFLYKPTPDDLAYWLSSNQPVILVCSRPKTDEAYFRNVQEWAKAPERRATGLIDFNKHTDRFESDVAARLFTLEAREPIVLDPPGPIPRPETVSTNLLPVRWDTDYVWAVDASTDDWGEVFNAAHDAGQTRSDFTIREGRLWALTEMSDEFLNVIGANDEPEAIPLEEFTHSGDRSRTNLLGELARRSLIAQHHNQLRWSGSERVGYFKLYENRPERTFKWGKGKGRTVVKPRKSLQHDGLSGYRHDAARLHFRRVGGVWVLSVSPTYLFTFDGKQVSLFHADALKKMKTQDRSTAVSQQIRMWAYLFTRDRSMLDPSDVQPFHFGDLLKVVVPVRPPEAAWAAPPDDVRGADFYDSDDDIDAALKLFDQVRDPW